MSALADNRTREILLTQPHTAQLVIDSPPGAGKTGVVERIAIQAAWVHGERVAVATQTKAQSADVAKRIANGWPQKQVHLFVKRGQEVSEDLDALPNLQLIESLAQLPGGPCIVIANAAKWSYTSEADFDLLVVDEAYQLRDSQFLQIAGLARRHVLVGDPGQIDPVVSSDTSRWRDMADGPHVPSPGALVARRPEQTLRLELPVSRRLPADSVKYIQPAFYPELPFTATSSPGDRLLRCKAGGEDAWDPAIDLASQGASLVLCEMPGRVTGEVDGELAAGIAGLVRRLMERDSICEDDGEEIELSPDEIGVVCAHRSQVYSVQERLGEDLSGVYVETADRYQGLERRVMIVHHPLSGRQSLGGFQLDSGRLCVMASRHRVACFLVARAGIADRLRHLPPSVERILGVEESAFHEGHRSHLELLERLDGDGRAVAIND